MNYPGASPLIKNNLICIFLFFNLIYLFMFIILYTIAFIYY
jgi:hypothetical protein